jgi:DNA-binding response OmpR family regulator
MKTSTTRRPRALLLDHDLATLRHLGTSLEAAGFEVRAATEGQGGLALLLDELLELDVVVAALDLPGRDGRALLRLVRRDGGERALGLVVLALGADAVVDRAAGAAEVARLVGAVAGFAASYAQAA